MAMETAKDMMWKEKRSKHPLSSDDKTKMGGLVPRLTVVKELVELAEV